MGGAARGPEMWKDEGVTEQRARGGRIDREKSGKAVESRRKRG